MTPRIISAATVVMTLPMRVEFLPERGGSVTASTVSTSVGGAYNVMQAAASQGVDVVNLSPLGTGPNSAIVRQTMEDASITTVSPTVVGDTGIKIVLIEADGNTTSIVAPGVEAELQTTPVGGVDVRAGDIVYFSAGDLLYPAYRKVFMSWLPYLPAGVRIAFAASPLIDQVDPQLLREILPHCDIVTMNLRENRILCNMFGVAAGENRFSVAANLPQDCIIVRRAGADGCTIKVGIEDEMHRIPAFKAETKDTIGVGETHIGVLLAHLALGTDPLYAASLANAAAAVAISIEGAPWCPDEELLKQIVAGTVTVAQTVDNFSIGGSRRG